MNSEGISRSIRAELPQYTLSPLSSMLGKWTVRRKLLAVLSFGMSELTNYIAYNCFNMYRLLPGIPGIRGRARVEEESLKDYDAMVIALGHLNLGESKEKVIARLPVESQYEARNADSLETFLGGEIVQYLKSDKQEKQPSQEGRTWGEMLQDITSDRLRMRQEKAQLDEALSRDQESMNTWLSENGFRPNARNRAIVAAKEFLGAAAGQDIFDPGPTEKGFFYILSSPSIPIQVYERISREVVSLGPVPIGYRGRYDDRIERICTFLDTQLQR